MKTGIYCINNTFNNHKYIGSSYNIKKRFTTHKNELRKNRHHSQYLQNAWNKYGEDSFKFIILTECDRDLLLIKEQEHFIKYNPEYNVSKSSIAPMEGRKHSKETKNKMSTIHKGNKYNLGHKWTKDQRKNILLKRIGSKRPECTKKKMSDTAKRINSIGRINRTITMKKIMDSNNLIYNSLNEAAKLTEHSVQAICDNLKGRSKKTRKGLIFKYVNS